MTIKQPIVHFTETDSVVIIAELANAHEGQVEAATALVDAAATSGADAVKFQIFTADELAVSDHRNYGLYRSLEMPEEDWRQLADFAHDSGLNALADVFGVASAELAKQVSVDGYKMHTSDLGNTRLLDQVARIGLPVLLSAGGSSWIEIAEAVETIRNSSNAQIVLMHGFQGYPTSIEDSYLRRIESLKRKFGLPVGFAAHADGGRQDAVDLPVWAVAAGAELVEVHLTLDRSKKGLDYYSSLEPPGFAEMTRKIREMETARGSRALRLSEAEHRYRRDHKKVVVTTREIAAGERVGDVSVALKRADGAPDESFVKLERVIGGTAERRIPVNSVMRGGDMRMKVAATLACRAESSRLYGKPLQRVGDRTILEHLIDRLRKVPTIDEVVLAIANTPSSEVFVALARQKDLKFVVGDEADVLGRLILAAESVDADIVIRQTTENPYIYWENLEELTREHIEEDADLTVTEGLPHGAWAEIISVEALKRSHRFGEDRHRSEFCTLFIAENPDEFVIKRVPAPDCLHRPDQRLTVDTPEDLIVVRTLWDALQKDGELITIAEIVAYLDNHPEVAAINSDQETLRLWK